MKTPPPCLRRAEFGDLWTVQESKELTSEYRNKAEEAVRCIADARKSNDEMKQAVVARGAGIKPMSTTIEELEKRLKGHEQEDPSRRALEELLDKQVITLRTLSTSIT